MARTKTDRTATTAATSRIWQRARRAAQDAKPVAAQVKPLASETKDAAARGLRKARAWAAPQMEHTGQVLQDSVAPKVAAALTSTARRLEPDKPRGRWRKVAGISAAIAAAAGISAAIAKRITPGTTAEAGEDEPMAAEPVPASADGAAPKPARTS
jgi:hypothetical protein